jgi:hypothetical protein
MEATRRSFLKGLFAVTAVAATGLPNLAPALPRIVGDGVHDDWAGLQACFDGEPFRIENESVVALEGRLSGGTFRISKTLLINGKGEFSIENVTFLGYGTKDRPMLDIRNSRGFRFVNCSFDTRG